MCKMSVPTLEIIRFASEDVIATSIYNVPVSMFLGGSYLDCTRDSSNTSGGESPSDWIKFEGSMGAYDSEIGGYLVNVVEQPNPVPSYYRYTNWSINQEFSGAATNPQAGDRDIYEIFTTSNGSYYTKGASHWDLYSGQ